MTLLNFKELKRLNTRIDEIEAIYDQYDDLDDDISENLERELDDILYKLERHAKATKVKKIGLRLC